MTNNPNTLRHFRLRNGITVVEHHQPNTIRDRVGNFIDDYIAVTAEDHKVLADNYITGYLTLSLSFDGTFPRGGSHGPDFDIVEELTNTTSEENDQ